MPEKLKDWKIRPHFWLVDPDFYHRENGLDKIEVGEDLNDHNSMGGCVQDIRTACLMAEIPPMHNLLIELSGADEKSFRTLQLKAREILKRIYSFERLQDYILFPMHYFAFDMRTDQSKEWHGDRRHEASWS